MGVEELKDKISKLEESVSVLSRENEMLRANVNPEVLANINGRHIIHQSQDMNPQPPH